MHGQLQANYENPGRNSGRDLLRGQMEQAASWTGSLAPRGLSGSAHPRDLDGGESRLGVPLRSPWLYLSLILMLGLLLL